MNKLLNVLNYVRYATASKLVVASALVLSVAGITGASLISNPQAAFAGDCSTNSIIKCGIVDANDLAAKYPTGDLPAIYSHFGLSADELTRFKQTAKNGTAYKDGRIVVDGMTVVEGAKSLGREKFNSYRQPYTIAGKTYYHSATQHSFAANSIPVLVMFNDEGAVETAIIKECGNPIWGNPKKPTYACDVLNMEKTNQKNTYNFSSKATVTNGATIAKVVYNFGDGTTKEETSPSTVVTHTYAKAGSYTATVTVHVNLPGGKTKVITPAGNCIKKIVIEEEKKPIFACTGLTGSLVKKEDREHAFVATASVANGATLTGGTFTFSGANYNVTAPGTVSGTTLRSNHKFPKEGTYTITADLTFNAGADNDNPKCATIIKIPPKTCEDTPNAPECQPPQECKPGIPVGDERCADTPAELPKTGPGEMLGGAVSLGSIVAAGYYYVGSRRNLIDTLLNR